MKIRLFRYGNYLSSFLILILVLGSCALTLADVTPVGDRTVEVRDAIVAASGVNSAADVTDAHLAAITALDLRGDGITELKPGDFSGLTGLANLNLYNNELSSLPNGIFDGLTALTTLRLGGNTVDPMPIEVSLEKVGTDQFKVVVPTGAPSDIVVSVSASNGSLAGDVTSLTVSKGSIDSTVVMVSRTTNTTAAVTANIGTLPGLPANHYGYVLSKSDDLPLEVNSAISTPVEPSTTDPTPPTDPTVTTPPVETDTNSAPEFTDGTTTTRSVLENTRTGMNIGSAVSADDEENDTLTYSLGGVNADTFDIDTATGQLKTKAVLDYEIKQVYVVTITVSDSELTDTISVIIRVVDVAETTLGSTELAVSDRTAEVRDTIVVAAGVNAASDVTTAHLAAITSLDLRNKGITSLKTGDFSGLSGLTGLNLYGNMLNSLPTGIFEGLTSLTSLRLGGNSVDPMPLTVSLQQVTGNQYKAVIPTGAPYDVVLSISGADVTTITISKGSLSSAEFTGTASASIGDLPPLPANHYGYILAKSDVCNRTLQVSDMITETVPGIDDCRNVTDVHLASITALDLSSQSLSSLHSDDLNGLISLTSLDLSDNQLSSLPVGIFSDLRTLSTLNLSGNTVDPLPISVMIQKVGTDQFKVVIPTGAPFTMMLPISVSNGSISGDVTMVTLSAGTMESSSLTVVRTVDTFNAVTVDISTLPSLPTGHNGYALTKSNQTHLEIFSAINVAPVFIEGATTSRNVAENTAAGENIGSAISATDRNNDTLTYSLGGANAPAFDIDESTGQLKTKTPLDFESKSTYTVTITVTDDALTDTITVTINVTDIVEISENVAGVDVRDDGQPNNDPIFTDGNSTSRSIAENTGSGVDIGSPISATDSDVDDTLRYNLGGSDAGSFSINSTNGQLRTSATLDYEEKSSYTVVVSVSDGEGGSDSITVTINVTDEYEGPANIAPTFTDGDSTSRSVAENTGSGVDFGEPVTATDENEDDTLSYSLGGSDAGSFSIDSTNGQLRTSAPLDYEETQSYTVVVSVSDGEGGSDSITVTINVIDVDESPANIPPTFTDGDSTSRSVAENTGSGVDIGDPISATDVNTGDTLSYSLGGSDSGSFSIDSTTGQLRTSAALNYEEKSSYTVIVSVSDGEGGSDSITVTITVSDVDEIPVNNSPEFTDTDPTTRSIAENTSSGVDIGSAVSATDFDGDTLSYSLGGADASSFDIDSETGQLRTSSALDHEFDPSYEVTVNVSDNNGGNDSISVTIDVTDVNEAPVFTDGASTSRTIAENVAADINIGSAVGATDPENDDLTYTLDDSTDAASIDIESDTGQLKTKAELDFDDKSSYAVVVTVTDGSLEDTISVTINIRNLDETPSNIAPEFTDGNATNRSVPENTASGENIGAAISATDDDSPTLFYLLSGTDASSFSIDDSTGQLKTNAALNFEGKKVYEVTVTVSDGSLTDEISVTINVTNVNEAPVFDTETARRGVDENTDAGENIGQPFSAEDPDVGDTLSYSLEGTDAAAFDIGSATGQLQTKAALDFEGKTSHSVIVKASDSEGLNDTIAVTINVRDIDENRAPTFTDGTNTERSVDENTGAGVDIGAAVSATDDDSDDTLEYSLGGTDAASFDIDSTSGQLRTKAALDFEDKNTYSVIVSVTDNNGGNASINVTIRVNDVHENRAPTFTDGTDTERSVDENTGSGVDIGNPVAATDDDTDDTLEYSLGGKDAGSFDIDSTNGQLRTKAALDFEDTNTYSVIVSVTDNNGGNASINVTIRVNDVQENRAPTFTDGTDTDRSVDENTGAGVDFGTPVSATDDDISDTLQYSLGGSDAASFDINSTSGQLRTKADLDFEGTNTYLIIVSVSDNNGGSASINVTINVNDVNETPMFTDGSSANRSVAENTGSGADIGSPVSATDEDDDTLEYTLEGTHAASFDIDSGTGQLKTKAALDHETIDTYSVVVKASDNSLTTTITVTIEISDVNEAPVFADGSSTSRSVAEDTSAGENIGSPVSATDPEDDTLMYSLEGADAASFDIDSTNGQLQTKIALDADLKDEYSVVVKASDNSLSTTIAVTIEITAVQENRAPTFTDSSFSYSISNIANASVGDSIGDPLTATDQDNDTLSYSVGGTDASFFTIVSSSGQLQVTQALIDSTKSVHSITVTANDNNGGTDQISGTVTIVRISQQVSNNTPEFTDGTSTSREVAENTASGENIGDAVAATDDDAGDTLTYSLEGTDASSFSIVSTSGQLQTSAALDYETKSSYSVTVKVTDDSGASNDSATIAVTITVTDVDEDTTITPVSDRTPAIRDAIVAKVPGITDAANVTEAHLAAITGTLNLSFLSNLTLKDGDFDGLTGITELDFTISGISSLPSGIFDVLTSVQKINFHGNNFTSLPPRIFDKNTALTELSFAFTKLTTLPADIFTNNTSLQILDFDTAEISSLPDGVFDDLTALRNIDLYENNLSSLSEGIFGDLTALRELDLGTNRFRTIPTGLFVNLTSLSSFHIDGNPVDPLALYVQLSGVTSGSFKVVVAAGAPFDITVPLSVTNGSIDSGATSVTIAKGSDQSNTLTVTRTSGTTGDVMASIGTLPNKPSNHRGYTLNRGLSLNVFATPINIVPVFDEGSTAMRSVEERTPSGVNIGDAITATDSLLDTLTYTLGGADAASFSIESSTGQLRTKSALDYEGTTTYTVVVTVTDETGATDSITVTIDVTDLADESAPTVPLNDRTAVIRDAILAAIPYISSVSEVVSGHLDKVIELDMSHYSISSLQTGDFDQLDKLERLYLSRNSLSSLPDDVFDGLSSLIQLRLDSNSLTSLPLDIFDDLSSLEQLSLNYNMLSSLPNGIFEELTSLENLGLYDNSFTSLPNGLFVNLTSLSNFTISNNPVDPLPLHVNLESVEEGKFKVSVPTGAPFDITVPLSVSGGTINDNITSVTIAKGSDASDTLTVTRTPDTTLRVYVFMGDLSDKPQGLHDGYVLTAGAQLKIFDGSNSPPIFEEGTSTTRSVTEGTIADRNIGDPVSATDGDLDALTYTLGGTNAGAFDIDGSTGQLKVKRVLDYDRKRSYSVVVSVSDGHGGTDSITVTINVLESFQPEFLDGSSVTLEIYERATIGVDVDFALIVLYDDHEERPALTVGGTDAASFDIDRFGQLKTKIALDYENKTSYFVVVTATDEYGRSDSINVTINVLDLVNESSVAHPLSARTTQIKDAIVNHAPDVTSASDVVQGHLDQITIIFINGSHLSTPISSLNDDDFDGLNNLRAIDLPWNNITSLPDGIFDGLTLLRQIDLHDNDLTTLPADVFDDLGSLEALHLGDNEISSLTSDIFSNQGFLASLYLDGNELSSLPDGLLAGLSPTTLDLSDNPGSPFTINVKYEKVADGQVKALCPIGAPHLLETEVVISNGTLAAGENLTTSGNPSDLLLSAGKTASAILDVVRDGNSAVSFDVTNVISDRSGLTHSGYTIAIDRSNLPLEVFAVINEAPNNRAQIPKLTAFLPNYPNPFNPETWIPYQLSKSADVVLTIYNMRGVVVRELSLGHKPAGYYTTRNRAAYWDGRNNIGEKVAAGVYFTTFKAGDFRATRKMLIQK